MTDAEEVSPRPVRRAASALHRWLRGDHADQSRFLAMAARLRRSHLAGLTVGATSIVVSFWAGPVVLATVVVAHLAIAVCAVLAARRPDRAVLLVAGGFLVLELDLAVAVAFSGGAASPLLPLLLVPLFGQGVCFRPQVLWAAMGLSVTVAGAAALAGHLLPPATAVPAVVHLLGYLALAVSVTQTAVWLATADLDSRDDAVIDALTGLHNRKALPTRFDLVCRSSGEGVSVVMLDIDHFKTVNDTYGHDRGDLVLQEVAEVLREQVRPGTLVHRLGGEEFLVLLPAGGQEDGVALAERLRVAISARPVAGLAISVSAGVSSGPAQTAELASLMKAADQALYLAKQSGRDCVRHYEDLLPTGS